MKDIKSRVEDIKNLPPALLAEGKFCLWKYESDEKGKPTKRPYNPRETLEYARVDNLNTFGPAAIAKYEYLHRQFDGIGIAVYGNQAGIDIDHCLTDGKPSDLAREIIDQMDAYTEISPSGTGIRILFNVSPDYSYDRDIYYIKNPELKVEIYLPGMTKRFLTVTGNVFESRKMDLVDRTDRLQEILDKYMRKPVNQTPTPSTVSSVPVDLSDAELIEKAKSSKTGPKFTALWNGDISGYQSHSEADLALCNLLAFWTGRDAARMENLFRQSGLMRKKGLRKDYIPRTIKKAIAKCGETYKPTQKKRFAKAPAASGNQRTAPDSTIPSTQEKPVSEQTPHDAGLPVVNLDQFHLFNEKGRRTGVFDVAIFEYLKKEYHMFVLGGVPYIYDAGCYYADENGAKLKTLIRKCIYREFIKSTTIKRVYELFLSDDELQARYDDLNQYPAEWINFRNGMYNPKTRQILPHDPKYMSVNQIPHVFDPAKKTAGHTVEEWLRFIVPDNEDREMLLEFAGYCMTRDVRQQKFMVLRGAGGTGKSTVLKMIEAITGYKNRSAVSLDELNYRFATYDLLGKLLNSCADLKINVLEDTSTLKKILGEDTLRGEAKGKDAFQFKSYAKLIFSCNELPMVKNENTNGFYRRLLVLTINTMPKTVRPDLFDSLSEKKEIEHFIRLCVDALERMYKNSLILNSTNSENAVKELRMNSDTVAAFMNEKLVVGNGKVKRSELYRYYTQYCHEEGRVPLMKSEFQNSLKAKGYEARRSNGNEIYHGLSIDEGKMS